MQSACSDGVVLDGAARMGCEAADLDALRGDAPASGSVFKSILRHTTLPYPTLPYPTPPYHIALKSTSLPHNTSYHN